MIVKKYFLFCTERFKLVDLRGGISCLLKSSVYGIVGVENNGKCFTLFEAILSFLLALND